MSNKKSITTISIAAGTAFVASLAMASVANAAEGANPFAMNELSSGYMQLAEGKCGGSMKNSKDMKDAKCGGEMKNKKEAKCGGDMKGKKEGKCGGDKAMNKDMKEGKCGGDKTMKKEKKEGKCGEGKCGGNS